MKTQAPLIEKMNYAIEGIIYTVRTQKNIRYHFCLAALVVLLGAILPISKTDYLLLIQVISLVLIAEIINTAIEELVNMVSPDHHPQAKIVKDIAAGAVLVSAICSVILGVLIFIPYLFYPASRVISFLHKSTQKESSAYILLFVLLILIVLIVIAKAKYGRGQPLHGGMPSGHAALAFSMFTAIFFLTCNPIIIMISLCLAVMVSHSRLLLKIHTHKEVLAGALLGTIITTFIFSILKYI